MSSAVKKATLEDLQEIIRDLGESQKAIQEAQEDTRELLKAAQKAAQEDTRELKAAQKEAQEAFKEEQQKTEEAIRRTQESIDKANGNFNNKWGAFMEDLVKGDLIRLLNERDIEVDKILSRVSFSRSKKELAGELDLIAINGMEVVVIEIKTSLIQAHVDKFLKIMETFRDVFPEYKDKKVYAGVAYLDEDGAAEYAMDRGLFVIKAPGGEAHVSTITNSSDFTPYLF